MKILVTILVVACATSNGAFAMEQQPAQFNPGPASYAFHCSNNSTTIRSIDRAQESDEPVAITLPSGIEVTFAQKKILESSEEIYFLAWNDLTVEGAGYLQLMI